MYNVSEDAGKAAILVISQVEDHRVQVTLTLTSTDMRNLPSPEEAEGMYSLVSIPCFHSPILHISILHSLICHTVYYSGHEGQALFLIKCLSSGCL